MLNRFYSLSFLFFTLSAQAEELQIPVSSGIEIPVSIFKAEKPDSVMLWLPSEYGLHDREEVTATELSQKGIEVWIADLHSAYFVAPGRSSYNNIKTTDITDLILAASGKERRQVILFATGRATTLALQSARALQLNDETNNIVNSAVLFHPNLFASTTIVGKSIEYLPITYATNLAIYIVQPSLSGKRYQLEQLEKNLQQGGSDVITQVLPGVADGFNLRKPDNATEESFYKKTPSIIKNATKLLRVYSKKRLAVRSSDTESESPMAAMNSGLQVYQGNIDNHYLDFDDLDNKHHTLAGHQGEVLLINFWATWCPPCVKELPSLNRLQSKINNTNFKILAVNIGEETAAVKKFLEPMSIRFPVLTDPNGESVNPWKLIAFPSSFVIDKHGKIRYGLFGGIEWDNSEVIEIIQNLLKQN